MKISRYLGLFFLLIAASALPLSAATGHFDRTLKVSGPVDLEVTSGSGDINVHTGGNGTVIVSAKIHARDSWFGGISAEEKIKRIESNPPIEQSGNSIHIGRIEDRDLRQNISIDYDVTVPAQTSVSSQTGSGDQMISGVQLPLTAKTGSGNIKIDNIGAGAHIRSGSGDLRINTVKGALNAEAGSGNIEAEGIAGEIYANTGSGDVQLHQVAAGDVQVQTGSGTVRIRGVKGGLRVQTGSGDIHAEGEPTHDWRVGAGSGNIDLRIPSGASFDLSAQTSSGTLNVNRQITMQGNFSRNHIEGKVGNGGVRLDLHTGSGNIQLD